MNIPETQQRNALRIRAEKLTNGEQISLLYWLIDWLDQDPDFWQGIKAWFSDQERLLTKAIQREDK